MELLIIEYKSFDRPFELVVRTDDPLHHELPSFRERSVALHRRQEEQVQRYL